MRKNATIERHELYYMAIQAKEGRYEAGPIIDNANNCPLREKLNLSRYRIPEHPTTHAQYSEILHGAENAPTISTKV